MFAISKTGSAENESDVRSLGKHTSPVLLCL